MAKNIVICSDGTGNTFDGRVSNVTRLVRRLRVDDRETQVVVYDQGVGTAGARTRLVRRIEGCPALICLPAHARWNVVARLLGLGFGYGLRRNVREMYCELARLYHPGDRVFLFGFSRGAFTVRALAGLLHRCHLPRDASSWKLRWRFRRAWAAYRPMQPHGRTVAKVRRKHRRCPIYFLGVWDTVKSYGGIRPIMLPHLRHNPSVGHVRHALALQERREWFKPTTWGRLDLDGRGAATRLDPLDGPVYASQDVCEAWFAGSHCDVGGGRIALRWMLGEAARLDPPLLLNDAGMATLRRADRAPVTSRSMTLGYRIADRLRWREIDNGGVWPALVRARRGAGRKWDELRRNGNVVVHATAREIVAGDDVVVSETWSGGA